MNLKDKVILITGGNSGIGLAAVRRFLKEGSKVVFTGRRQEALESVSEFLEGNCLGILADAKDLHANAKVFDAIAEKFGKIDCIFINAGIASFTPFPETSEQVFDDIINTNLKGPFFTIQESLKYLNDGASIIFNTTIAAQVGIPNLSAYAASKGALRSLVRVLAVELAPRDIRVNAVSPGPIETPLMGKMGIPNEMMEAFGKGVMDNLIIKKFGQPEDVANMVAFLASEESAFITGNQFEVDGGTTQI